jgi:hypothetical protein
MTCVMNDLRYPRLVWRRLGPNEASRNSAGRYGFVPEGRWRGSAIFRGHRWDQVWYSIMADEWPERQPERQAAIAVWIADGNFDEKAEHGLRCGRATYKLALAGEEDRKMRRC